VGEHDRARVVAALGCVDCVVVFDEDTPADLIAALSPDVLVKGGDYAPDAIAGASHVRSTGGEVVIIPLLPDRSTTRLVERLRVSP
jgi:D-beta-D-heptose 7-phosphate kinase/D-beta-D-heptose 1-phosphate adenosyltransferase